MESKRQQKFGKLIQEELSGLFQKELRHIIGNEFVTITAVHMSPDLSIAKVYFSMSLVRDKEGLLEQLHQNVKEIRYHLGKRIGKQVRNVPEVRCYIDDTIEQASRIDQLLSDADIPPPEDENNDDERKD